MRYRIDSYIRLAALLLMLGAEQQVAGQTLNDSSVWEGYNVKWTSQSLNSSGSMPLNGGDMALNVWVENGELMFYLSRTGSFSENGMYLKLGRVRVKLSPNPFAPGAGFRQELKLRDGYIEIEGRSGPGSNSAHALVKLWVDVFRSDVHVQVNSDQPVQTELTYENWRYQDRALPIGNGERFSIFNIMGYPGSLVESKDSIRFLNNAIMFYHRNPDSDNANEKLIRQQGMEAYRERITDDLKYRTFGGYISGDGLIPAGEKMGEYANTPCKGWKLKSRAASKNCSIVISTHIAQSRDIEGWRTELLKSSVEARRNEDEKFQRTRNWWRQFWDRSWIHINPGKKDSADPVWQMSRNYQLFRYQLGGNVTGEYPTKFNGGSLTFDSVYIDTGKRYTPDFRQWGGSFFTAQNQRLLYWPMLKSGDFDAILPQFDLYRKGLGGAKARVEKYFGHSGAVYSEYTGVSGLAFGDGWGWKDVLSDRRRGVEIPFGDAGANSLGGYGDTVEAGIMSNGFISYHWESQVEHAFMILEYHRFTGLDISRYMEFIEQSLIFFNEHYRKRQQMRNGNELDENGKLVFFPSTSCESYRGVKNPTDLVSGIRACITSLLALDSKYITEERKTYYQQYLSTLPEYSYEVVKGDSVLKPAEHWVRYQNVECPQFYPLFPFNQFTLGKDKMDIFKNTWKHGLFAKDMVMSWHQDGIFFARMGLTQDAANYNTRKLKDSERRYPTFWGPGHDWVPDHNWGGSGMIGLQEMLMQTNGKEIYLLPAWPVEWDVHFKLHAPGRTTVECRVVKGVVKELKVEPQSRTHDIIMMAPFMLPSY